MFFIEWWLAKDVLFSAVAVALCGVGFTLAKRSKKRRRANGLLKIASGAVGFIAAFLISLTLLLGLRSSYSAPVFSPAGDKAVRVRSLSMFDLHLKDDFVELYTRHGLRNEVVFLGELDGVQPSSIKWISDSELVVPYSKHINLGGCQSTSEVKVLCISTVVSH